MADGSPLAAAIADAHRREWAFVLAATVRVTRDLDLAEECVQDAYARALEHWGRSGIPASPGAWLTTVARRRALDLHRRSARLARSLPLLLDDPYEPDEEPVHEVPDDRLRLIFTCCHPALAIDARVALTLREVCGLETEAIARAFLTSAPALAQRIVRAKGKIRDARIPYQIPSRADLPERLDAVLHVVYLVFNEGYSASSGQSLIRPDLTAEAIRLARLLVELLPDPEAIGLLALVLLHDSRRAARTSPAGALVLLDDQDRTSWNREQIAEGLALVERALSSQRFGPYTLQAAIAAVHAEAASAAATDWRQIVGLYDVLLRVNPSPVVELNRAAAIAMADGAEAGLAMVDGILARGDLADYHLAHAARADLCRRLGRVDEAIASYRRAAGLTRQEPERRFLAGRLAELRRLGDRKRNGE